MNAETPKQVSWINYPARAVATFLVACVFGPIITALCLASVELASAGYSYDLAMFADMFVHMLTMSYVLGGPIAIIAGLIVAFRVGRNGNIPLYETALIAFLTPFVPLVILGGGAGVFFGIFYGVPAAIAAVFLQMLGTFVWKQVSGHPV